ncbi:hypothetical protein BDV96DRAFT_587584 [Lophiotrema nucula]|uniref:Mid2 domain-containing protein n=1 Tax=Lophiotrema nucula TaxID=690887 RepID=A0A6A5YPJ0_9PLEO|nr:hypothetical protein BDV96DRAFT_587584 [Lophiotrema nucula]
MLLEMQYAVTLLSALAALPAANGVAFGGPAPTNTSPNRALDGFTPKPTRGPSVAELRRRQNAGAETCGWVDEDLSSAITCNGDRSCVLYTTASGGTTAGMAGCCSAGDTQDCGWAYSCIDYSLYSAGGCDSSCEADDFVRKCTATDAPYCTTWLYASDSVFDYGCGTDAFDTIQTIYPTGIDGSSTSSLTLETISDDAIVFSDASSEFSDLSSDFTGFASATDTGIFSDFTTDTLETATDSDPQQTQLPTVGGAGKTKTKKGKKKVSIGLIIGVVIGVLVLLGVIAAVLIILCVKQKKKKQLAANQVAIANAQAMRPQSSVNPAAQPQMQQAPPPVPQQHNPGAEGYFNQQQAYGNDQKINPQTQVHEHGVQTPISNPTTPAPPYAQPYYATSPVVPPMPTPSPAPYPAREPTPGTHEVDAISVAHPPNSQPGQVVHEIGGK